jgi:hypothetical protein
MIVRRPFLCYGLLTVSLAPQKLDRSRRQTNSARKTQIMEIAFRNTLYVNSVRQNNLTNIFHYRGCVHRWSLRPYTNGRWGLSISRRDHDGTTRLFHRTVACEDELIVVCLTYLRNESD